MTMDSKWKRIVAAVALAGAISVGTAGAAFAADGSSGTGSAPSAAVAHPRIRIRVRRAALRIYLQQVGGTRAALVQALRSGTTLAQYAQEQGKDPSHVAAAIVQAGDDAIDKLVANHRISSDRGAQLKDALPGRVDKLMNHVFGQGKATT